MRSSDIERDGAKTHDGKRRHGDGAEGQAERSTKGGTPPLCRTNDGKRPLKYEDRIETKALK